MFCLLPIFFLCADLRSTRSLNNTVMCGAEFCKPLFLFIIGFKGRPFIDRWSILNLQTVGIHLSLGGCFTNSFFRYYFDFPSSVLTSAVSSIWLSLVLLLFMLKVSVRWLRTSLFQSSFIPRNVNLRVHPTTYTHSGFKNKVCKRSSSWMFPTHIPSKACLFTMGFSPFIVNHLAQ